MGLNVIGCQCVYWIYLDPVYCSKFCKMAKERSILQRKVHPITGHQGPRGGVEV
jgi:hypothetical protein